MQKGTSPRLFATELRLCTCHNPRMSSTPRCLLAPTYPDIGSVRASRESTATNRRTLKSPVAWGTAQYATDNSPIIGTRPPKADTAFVPCDGTRPVAPTGHLRQGDYPVKYAMQISDMRSRTMRLAESARGNATIPITAAAASPHASILRRPADRYTFEFGATENVLSAV